MGRGTNDEGLITGSGIDLSGVGRESTGGVRGDDVVADSGGAEGLMRHERPQRSK
jgi:hypothetical protein